MKTVGIIPARLASSRLPEKLLLAETGKPLIEYVWRAAVACPDLDEVIVATDSSQIADVVKGFGGRAEMTGKHPSGTDRVAEVVARCCPDADLAVNLQGDEPELNPAVISGLCQAIRSADCEMATVATPIRDPAVVQDPNSVKVVINNQGLAMYFSRAPIPYPRDGQLAELIAAQPTDSALWHLHVGIYAYRTDFLLKLTSMKPSSLEMTEKLEQLRALQSGAQIAVSVISHAAVGIDTREDYDAFVSRQNVAI